MKKNKLACLLAGLLTVGTIGAPVSVFAEGIHPAGTAVVSEQEAEADTLQEDAPETSGSERTDAAEEPAQNGAADSGIGVIPEESEETAPEEDRTAAADEEENTKAPSEVGEETLEEEEAEAPGISWNVKADGTCEIRFIDNVMYPDLRFAVWSEDKGQDDLTWNPATSVSSKNNEWVCAFKTEKLKSLGRINIHAYTGATTCVGKLLVDVGQPSAGSVTVTDLNVAAGTCTLLVSGLTHPELIRSMVIPTWSSPKQEDIQWYNATKVAGASGADPVYKVRMSLANHKYNQGTYHAHVYMTDCTGKQTFQVKTDVAFEARGTLSVSPTEQATAFRAEIKDLVVPGGYSKPEFAVWTKENGQDDLKWVQADSNHSAIIDINDYQHLGEFIVHSYVTTKAGKMQFVGGAAFTPEVAAPEFVLGESKDGVLYPVTVKNVLMQTGLKAIKVAVWSEKNGQDDLKWYTAAKQADGTFKAMIDLKNHKTTGKYFIHVYAETTAGKMQFLGKNDDLVVEEPAPAEVVISDVKPEQGTFVVTVKVPQSVDPISTVSVPVWCAADQSDIKWYSTKKLSSGEFQVQVKSSNHKEHAGIYQIHVYGNYASGFSTCIAKTSQELRPAVLSVTDAGKGKRTVVYRGDLNARSVSVPVWSSDNGQDDLVWYQATKNSNGFWQVTIDPARHKNAGLYLVHVYADGAFVANTTYTLAYSEVKTDYTELANNMKVASDTEQLILVGASGTTAEIVMLNKNTDGTWYQMLATSGYVGINGVGPTTEWNRRTPPGVFGFTQAFGILPNPGTAFDYVQVDQTYYWVDDVDSRYYNRFVTTRKVARDWSSAEHLIDYAGSYNYCLAIDYNPDCTPGVGSAIFLHCSSGRPTAGCVSVPESVMRRIMQNVRRDCKIVIDSKSGLASY